MLLQDTTTCNCALREIRINFAAGNQCRINMQAPVKIFVVYAHEDKPVRDKLLRQLRPLAEKGEIELWSDHEIKPGALWDEEIRLRLTESEIILLLVSDDFFASDYIRRVEFQTALDLHARGQTRLVPVIARHCGWADVPALSRLQALPPEGRPVLSKEWDSADEPYLKIYEGVKAAVREVRSKAASRTSAEQAPATTSRNWKPIAFAAVIILAASAGVFKFLYHQTDTENPAASQTLHLRDSLFSKPEKPDTSAAKKKNIPPTEITKDKEVKPKEKIVAPKTNPSDKPLTDIKKSPETQMLPKEDLENLGLEHQLPPVEGMSRVINKNHQQGYLNISTRQIIGWFEDTENFNNGRAYIKQNGRYFYIDKTGRCIDLCD